MIIWNEDTRQQGKEQNQIKTYKNAKSKPKWMIINWKHAGTWKKAEKYLEKWNKIR